MKISVVIITLNEARNILRCLNSVSKIADEIIVLDAFSSDATLTLCQQQPHTRVIQRTWQGYSASKNYANQQAKFEYILSLDADEALSPALQQSLYDLKQQPVPQDTVYQITRITNYCGHWIRYSGWYPDHKIRLFPNSACQWQGDFVHETLAIPAHFTCQLLKGDCYHYSYYSVAEHRERAFKYATLGAEQLVARHKTCSIWRPYGSAVVRFLTMYLVKLGFLDGAAGFKIAQVSAAAVYLKYQTVRRLTQALK